MLSVDGIHTSYGDSSVLTDVSLTVESDQVVALLGRNGAGKTTTLRSIMGIQPPSAGSIRLQDEDITGLETYEIAQKGVGYVPEDRRVFPTLTVEEHILMSLGSRSGPAEEELSRLYDTFSPLEPLKSQEARHLSGGEQQMLSIARALATRPKLLLLDEPSEGLAPSIVQTVFDTIETLRSDMTILLVEQNYVMARKVADQYYILDNGAVVSSGQMEELEQNDSLKETYLGVS